jgi:hypothetical protein
MDRPFSTTSHHPKEHRMLKIKLDLDRLEVVSFETGHPGDDDGAVAAITGLACVTRPTIYGTCCTP